MNPQTHTEEDYLALLDKTEDDKYSYLGGMYLFNNEWCCLDRLAERLWHKAKMVEGFCDVIIMVIDYEMDMTVDESDHDAWWAFDSRPIHRIVASFIALRRAGVESI